ncbi:Cu(I)-responsive transcriptional regulator [Rubellimicrobium arenae]|uniref:Cu(I)-responsive transcriptional regulator n=1 Tax=Rubellimicrobium arenae TaxID=2817372 RepID=UPI001B30E07D|nr:Cu(I)-responsive transcriptional regulator [Rubellimicrobium arenae]
MNIGEASRVSGVSAKMIRYYEEIGLIPPAPRRDSGYRDYAEADVHRLRFIRRARDLGFTVDQITELLGLWSDRSRASSKVRSLALSHVDELARKKKEIEAMISLLERLVRSCHGDDRPDCPILDELAADEAEPFGRPATGPQRFGQIGERKGAGRATRP